MYDFFHLKIIKISVEIYVKKNSLKNLGQNNLDPASLNWTVFEFDKIKKIIRNNVCSKIHAKKYGNWTNEFRLS